MKTMNVVQITSAIGCLVYNSTIVNGVCFHLIAATTQSILTVNVLMVFMLHRH